MHIENVYITLGVPPALFEALKEPPAANGENGLRPAAAPQLTQLPKIGDAWPGIDGVYAGLSRGEEGEPDAHLVLLNAQPERDMNWADAIAWAQGLGDGARLPTRFESALLYANVRDKVDTGRWHWTGTQYSGYDAWIQNFDNGGQNGYDKKFEARARAVRRLVL